MGLAAYACGLNIIPLLRTVEVSTIVTLHNRLELSERTEIPPTI